MPRLRLLVLPAMVMVTALFIAAAASAPVKANGVPQLIKLEPIPGVSNFGPPDAEGVLEFSFAERYAHATVKNLVPEPGYIYEGWMTNDEGRTLKVGEFDIDGAGIGVMESRFENLDSYDYDLFLVAARGEGDTAGEMPQNLAIGGNFTIIEDAVGGQPSPGDTRPVMLPDTGASPGSTSIDPLWGAFTAMAVTGLLIAMFSIFRNRRSAA